jgi:hypothetical protein
MKTASMLTVLALLLAAAPASAQFTLTQGSFPATGSHTVGEAVSPAAFSVGSAGAGQTWTFGDYTWNFVRTEELVVAASSPYYANFPTANRCILMTGGDSPAGGTYVYYRMAANGMYFLGTGSTDTVLVPVEEARVVPFPCAFQTQWTTVIRYQWEPVPGYLFSVTDSSVRTADGWGTLATPYGSHPALRFFTHLWVITRMPIVPPTITESVAYGWYSSQGEELMGVSSGNGVTDPNFSSGYLNMTGVPLAVEPVRGPVAQNFAVGQNYPNPFNPGTMLPVELEKTGRVTLDIYDETGRRVSHGEYELSAGHHDLSVSGSNWAAGTYFARVMAAAQAQTVKMQLVK